MHDQAQMTTEQWLEQIHVEAQVVSRTESASIWPMNARSESSRVVIGVSDSERGFEPAIEVELTVLEWLQETRERDALFMASSMVSHYEGLMMRVFDQLQSLTVPAGSVFVLSNPVVLAEKLDRVAVQSLMQRALPDLAMSKTGTLRRHMKQAVVFMTASSSGDEAQMAQVLGALACHSDSYPKVMAA